MAISLSDHFTVKKLIRFTLPSVIMMIFTSIYGVVDGYFVSNFVGKTPFAAVNFIMPFLMMLGAIGFMLGAGGSALIAKYLGEKNNKRANSTFSMIVYVAIFVGILIAALGILFLRPISQLLGASGTLLDDSVRYGTVILIALPAFMLQIMFQTLFITAEKPKLGLAITLVSGFTNMILDALLVAVFPLGLEGAAWATAISQMVGGVIPLIYFLVPNKSLLSLGKASFNAKDLIKTCTNGSSELMSNISMSLVGMLYNIQLLAYAGENGIAAYGVLMYVNFIFISAFIGYSIGVAPVISYHYGAKNQDELKNLLKKSATVILTLSASMLILSFFLAYPLSYLFVGYDPALLSLTLDGFFIFSFSFLFAGIAIYGSSFFTALNNGAISALISFLRTLVFQVASVLLLPLIFNTSGIWYSIVIAELLAAAVTVIMILSKRKKYGYL